MIRYNVVWYFFETIPDLTFKDIYLTSILYF